MAWREVAAVVHVIIDASSTHAAIHVMYAPWYQLQNKPTIGKNAMNAIATSAPHTPAVSS